jgi:hypothetical protein
MDRPGGPGDPGVSDEARVLAASAAQRAAAAPTAGEIRALAVQALSEERDAMTPAEIRAVAAKALGQAQQISTLMTRLADLLDGGEKASDG